MLVKWGIQIHKLDYKIRTGPGFLSTGHGQRIIKINYKFRSNNIYFTQVVIALHSYLFIPVYHCNLYSVGIRYLPTEKFLQQSSLTAPSIFMFLLPIESYAFQCSGIARLSGRRGRNKKHPKQYHILQFNFCLCVRHM